MDGRVPGDPGCGPRAAPGDTDLDGELVVSEAGRLAFERLQEHLARSRGTGALAAAQSWPAHLVAFDLPCLDDADLTSWPYTRRQAWLPPFPAGLVVSAPVTARRTTAVPRTEVLTVPARPPDASQTRNQSDV
ncbi:hypothetical protein AB0O68_20110 [Streptomyces sp. NPDC087512]|uniref:hypothetical protein n=1 Tax=Streptomyces sp. NPDC087512 TaxID=3155059 RepID=UPI00341B0F97